LLLRLCSLLLRQCSFVAAAAAVFFVAAVLARIFLLPWRWLSCFLFPERQLGWFWCGGGFSKVGFWCCSIGEAGFLVSLHRRGWFLVPRHRRGWFLVPLHWQGWFLVPRHRQGWFLVPLHRQSWFLAPRHQQGWFLAPRQRFLQWRWRGWFLAAAALRGWVVGFYHGMVLCSGVNLAKMKNNLPAGAFVEFGMLSSPVDYCLCCAPFSLALPFAISGAATVVAVAP